MYCILMLSVVIILQVLFGIFDLEEFFNYLMLFDFFSEDILFMFEQFCYGDVVCLQERFMLENFILLYLKIE